MRWQTSPRLRPPEHLSPTGIPSCGPHRSPAALSLSTSFQNSSSRTSSATVTALYRPRPLWAVLRVLPWVILVTKSRRSDGSTAEPASRRLRVRGEPNQLLTIGEAEAYAASPQRFSLQIVYKKALLAVSSG